MDYITPLINWLSECDYVKSNKLFLNAIKAKNDSIQIVTQQIAKNQDVEYIDGSILHKVHLTIFDYKSISFNQLVKSMVDKNENIADLLETGSIIEFIESKNQKQEFPNFGDRFDVQKIYCAYNSPSTPSIDGSISPALAKYSIPIICEVIEYAE